MKKKLFISLSLVALVATLAWAGTADIKKYGIRFQDEGSSHSTPPSGYADLYVNGDTLYFLDDTGNNNDITTGANTAYDDIGDPDANSAIDFTDYYSTWDFGDTDHDMFTMWFTGAFGDYSGVVLEQKTGNPTDGTLLELKLADTDVDFLSMATSGVEKVNIADDGSITLSAGDITLSAGDLTVGGAATFSNIYQTAIASASSGNTNLTIDASGTGTITLGASSTGKIATDNLVDMAGNVDIGDDVTDTLTITSSIDGNVTLDDGSGASPSLVFQDGTNETATFSKADTDVLSLTTEANDGLNILTGNLWIGNASPGTASMDGEDLYVEGESEFDGAMQVDGAATFASSASIATANITTLLNVDEDIDVDFNANDEEISVDSTATDYAAGAGIMTIHGNHAGNTNDAPLMRLVYQANGDAEDTFLLCEDNSTGAAANGDQMFKVGSGGAVTSASTVTATGGVSAGNASTSYLKTDTVELSNADIKALRATPKTLISAPGTNTIAEFVSAVLILDYGSEALTESADNLVIEYEDGQDITGALEMTGFIDQTADQVSFVIPAGVASMTAATATNKAIQLFNTGDGEFGGNASGDTTMTVKVTYRVHADGL